MHKKYGKYIAEMLIKADVKNTVLNSNSDVRNADLFACMFKDIVRYVPNRKSWFYYDDVRWIKDENDMITMELCKVLAGKLIQYVQNECDNNYDLLKNAIKWQKLKKRQDIIKDARSVYPIDASLFDSNPNLFNCQNGTFDLKRGEFREHRADDLITKLIPVDFVQGAENDRWNKFIMEIMSDDVQKAEFLQKALGYSLSGNTNQECLYILYGATTRNGKGTLMESIMGVLGDYAKAVRPETLSSSVHSSNSHSEDIARLNGVRLANISEPAKNMRFNASLVKSLTGGDTINARFLNENSFDFKPQMKIYINTNYLPSVNDSTVFSSNRLVVIPFERHFKPEEQDKSLKHYFATSEVKSAILNWLIEGYFKGLVNFEQPESVKQAIADYEKRNDYIYVFLNDVLVRYDEGKTPVSEAHRQYNNWASNNGYDQMSLVEFGRQISTYVDTSYARINGVQLKCICDRCCR